VTASPAFTGIYGTRRLRCLEANICTKGTAAPIGPLRRSERVRGALDEFVSEFGFGRRQPRDSGATNLLRGSLIKARCRLVSWE
jgi:hypothetical protein